MPRVTAADFLSTLLKPSFISGFVRHYLLKNSVRGGKLSGWTAATWTPSSTLRIETVLHLDCITKAVLAHPTTLERVLEAAEKSGISQIHPEGNRLGGPRSTVHSPGVERQIHVVCIGAGASGLLLAYKLQRNFRNYSLTCYEKNDAVSGTWYENRYTGCACDVPSHNYTWSFEPKLDWSSVYPPASEIREYFESFAAKYDLLQYVKLSHQVIGVHWNHQGGGYDVRIKNQQTGVAFVDHADILINAGGFLTSWKWPDIPGLDKYQGSLLHTAK
ncbi:putative sterigmatocystin biosynthesis monooxygenase stcW [Colletotrichum orbiculare MAFF 240422]|uniref:Sterigmatocystin biosynthesis monooxygenase stcW n=1 Tax=Colletotrichum orbiculare (strain 104-T / ATCC 96160 / CBS 514.97 / LARS 414 / MAFF 240422) TaxID=1213857 RepID=A0A484FLY5_COLOR|nr:putative sterigmatocystin biosynthesis monooxygenase stcW [Colletotrichum orbiculare MAFF 240422]